MSKIAPRRKTRPRGYIEGYQPQAKTLELLGQVRAVISEYEQYLPITIRQIFYRLVGQFGFEKTEAAYERLCNHLNNARRARLIPFDAIRDDGVVTIPMEHFEDQDDFRRHLRTLAANYRINKLSSQPVYMEVWCEAAGMLGQLARVAHRYSVPTYSSSGFDSTSARKDIAERICRIGKPTVIMHLGDFDPSGESIFDVLAEDVGAFVAADRPWGDCTVRFKRVALTADQVAAFGLETTPAKASDSRSKRWSGGTAQLEALAPDQIAELLDAAILAELDPEMLEIDRSIEGYDREDLTKLLLAGPGGAAP